MNSKTSNVSVRSPSISLAINCLWKLKNVNSTFPQYFFTTYPIFSSFSVGTKCSEWPSCGECSQPQQTARMFRRFWGLVVLLPPLHALTSSFLVPVTSWGAGQFSRNTLVPTESPSPWLLSVIIIRVLASQLLYISGCSNFDTLTVMHFLKCQIRLTSLFYINML